VGVDSLAYDAIGEDDDDVHGPAAVLFDDDGLHI